MNEKIMLQSCAFCECVRETYPEGTRMEPTVVREFLGHLKKDHELIP